MMSKCPSPTSTDPYTEPETFDSGTGGICGCLTLAAIVIVGVAGLLALVASLLALVASGGPRW